MAIDPTERTAYSYFDATEYLSVESKYAVCGPGLHTQANIQKTENPSFELLTAATEEMPGHDPDLVKLAQEVNQFFSHKAETYILDKRAATGIPRLELTVRLAPEGLRLVTAYPRYRASKAPTPQWVLGGHFWLWLSRVVYRATHWRHPHIPETAKSETPASKAKSLPVTLKALPKIKSVAITTK